MAERTIRTCDACGKDLMVADDGLGWLGGQRYVRLQEVPRDLRVIHTMSSDAPLERGVFCGKDCLCNWLGVPRPSAES